MADGDSGRPEVTVSVAESSEGSPPESRTRMAWRAHWQSMGQPWRTEPEIESERRTYLVQRRQISPQIGRGIYPFGSVSLSRADVEWLLATHEGGMGPVQWKDEGQREREGLDLRGAVLRGVDLRGLPLARLCGGLTGGTDEQYEAAALHLEGTRLANTDLRGANLRQAHLEQADLQHAQLTEASLVRAYLMKADLRRAQLQAADLREAHLENADLREAHVEGGRLQEAFLGHARMGGVFLEGAILDKAHLDGALLQGAHLEATFCRGTYFPRAYLREAHLAGAFLLRTHLEDAHLESAHLEGAELRGAYLQGTNLYGAHLEGRPMTPEEAARLGHWRHWNDLSDHLPPADLRGAFLDSGTNLRQAILGTERYGYILLADVNWGGANLSVVPWSPRRRPAPWKRRQPVVLGDERNARQRNGANGKAKDAETRYDEYEAAVRANRQLAVALRSQGLDEDAAYFAYRAQVLQRQVLLRQYRLGAYVFSLFLDGLAGYGYRPVRSLITYLLVILSFGIAYYITGPAAGIHLSPLGALVFSVTSFHGRGFFPGGIPLDDPLTTLAAGEALSGLLIEISFIATFTQRFFGK